MPNAHATLLHRLAVPATIALLIPVAIHGYLATAGRYVGDDYCAASVFQDEGLIGGQIWFYKYWNAVPTTVALMAATHPGDVETADHLPAVVLALWLVAAAWTIRRVARVRGIVCDWRLAGLLAALIVFATLDTAPNVVQTLYLRVPMLAYIAPLLAMTSSAGLIASLIARGARSPLWLLAVAAIAFVIGSFGPVVVTAQIAIVGLAALAALVTRSRSAWPILAAVMAGSIAALVFVVAAPGNATRQQMFPVPPGPLTIVKWSLLYSAFMFVRPFLPPLESTIVALVPAALGTTPRWIPMAMSMATSPITVLLVLVVPAVLSFMLADAETARRLRPLTRACLLWVPPLVFVVVVACMAPGAYGTSSPPPPRALVIPGFFMITGGVVWASALGVRLRAAGVSERTMRVAAIAGVALLLWSTTAAANVAWGRTAELRAWASRWDETDRQLREARAAGNLTPTVPVVGSIAGVGSIAADPNDWVNVCAARYYDLESISGTSAQ